MVLLGEEVEVLMDVVVVLGTDVDVGTVLVVLVLTGLEVVVVVVVVVVAPVGQGVVGLASAQAHRLLTAPRTASALPRPQALRTQPSAAFWMTDAEVHWQS